MQMTDWRDTPPDEIVEQVNAMMGLSFAELDALDWPHRVAIGLSEFAGPLINAAANMPRIEPSYGGFDDKPVALVASRGSVSGIRNVECPAGNRHARRAAAARRR